MKLTAVFLTFFSLSLSAQITCESYFRQLEVSAFSTPFLKALDFISAPEGGRVILFQEVQIPFDRVLERPDPHGRISSLRNVLKIQARSFWGLLKSTQQTQGDVDFLNERIRMYNRFASSQAKIPFSFATTANSSDRALVAAHGAKKVLIAESGYARMHTLNYRVFSNLAIPRSFHIEAQKKSLILEQFYQYLEQHDLLSPKMETLMQRLFLSRAQDLSLVGNVQVALASLKSSDRKTEFVNTMSLQQNILSHYIRSEMTAMEYLEARLTAFKPSDISASQVKMFLARFKNSSDPILLSSASHLSIYEGDLALEVYSHYEAFIQKSINLSHKVEPLSVDN